MRTLTAVKRMFVIGALLVGIGAAGDAMNIGSFVSAPFRSDPVVADGYVSPKSLEIETEKNGNGEVATYLVYTNGEGSQQLPVTQGASGPRVGNADYLISSLTPDEQKTIFYNSWTSLPADEKQSLLGDEIPAYSASTIEGMLSDQQKNGIFASQWYAASSENKTALISEVWPALDIKYRHGVVREELEMLLEK
ncbi:hypothetical protein JXB11_04440 [Candidatus Woesearchaeota archaeon]|nr:hypothetical protein [Candidatus Woesearchaeota archaeon]